jgi:hypothetical protein
MAELVDAVKLRDVAVALPSPDDAACESQRRDKQTIGSHLTVGRADVSIKIVVPVWRSQLGS